MLRVGIRPPKFADKFDHLDFEAMPMPVISLYPFPDPVALESLRLQICGMDCKPRSIPWTDCDNIPRVSVWAPLVCSIFNWAQVVEWGGVRLCDFLDHVGLEASPDEYLAFYSRDGAYFESMPVYMARDPRVMLVTALNGQPLPGGHGGPLRLFVPFLQGYKSVKWLGGIRASRHDPIGIKRLLGQSKNGRLGRAWRDIYGIVQPDGEEKTPV